MPEQELSALTLALTPRLTPYIPHDHAPEPPQTAFLLLQTLEAFYGGSAGGGKSDALLMAALQYVDVPGYSALILRRTFPELSQPGAIMARSHEWLAPWRKHGVAWNEQRKRWTFPGGATLTFGYLRSIRDVYQYQGAEFQFVGFDELTQFPEEPYVYLFSRLRRPDQGPLSKVPLRMRSASNPGNIGHGWVKSRLVSPEARAHGRVFIPARLKDNPHLDADEYERSLSHLPPLLQRQLLDGDWGAFEGMAYPQFKRGLHVIPAFDLPEAWERFESMDYGSSNPTAWGAFAVDYDGNVIAFDRIYQPGLPSELAPLVKEKRAWWHPNTKERVRAWADPSLWIGKGVTNQWGHEANSADEFSDHGIQLERANNDRRAGYLRVSEMLRPDPARVFPAWHPRAGEPGSPRLFIFESYEELAEQIENAPLEQEGEPWPGEAVSRAWEGPYGHAHAQLRYGLLSRPGPSVEPPSVIDDPRAALLAEHERRLEKKTKTRSRYR